MIMGKHLLDARYEVPIGVVTLWQMLALIILALAATVALALLPA